MGENLNKACTSLLKACLNVWHPCAMYSISIRLRLLVLGRSGARKWQVSGRHLIMEDRGVDDY